MRKSLLLILLSLVVAAGCATSDAINPTNGESASNDSADKIVKPPPDAPQTLLQSSLEHVNLVLSQTKSVSCKLTYVTETKVYGENNVGTRILKDHNVLKTTSMIYEIAPDRLRIDNELTIQSGTDKGKTIIRQMIYDGTYQWWHAYGEGTEKKSSKADTRGIVTAEHPYNTMANLPGTGLWTGEGMFGTVKMLLNLYDINKAEAKNIEGVDYLVLEGDLNEDKLVQNLKDTFQSAPIEFVKSISHCKIIFASSDYFVRGYQLEPAEGFEGALEAKLTASFTDVQLNPPFPESWFAYQPPVGATIEDITGTLKAKRKKLIEGQSK